MSESTNETKNVKAIGKTLPWEDVDRWVKKYQDNNEPETSTYGWLFGCDILCKLMAHEGVEGIWFFKAINDEGKERLVMYPADENGKVLGRPMKSLGAMSKSGDPIEPGDDGEECPPDCP